MRTYTAAAAWHCMETSAQHWPLMVTDGY